MNKNCISQGKIISANEKTKDMIILKSIIKMDDSMEGKYICMIKLCKL